MITTITIIICDELVFVNSAKSCEFKSPLKLQFFTVFRYLITKEEWFRVKISSKLVFANFLKVREIC